MIRWADVTLGSHLSPEFIGLSDDLLDLLNQPPRSQSTTDEPVDEGDQSHETDDRAHEIVERKQQHDSEDQPPPLSLYPTHQAFPPVS